MADRGGERSEEREQVFVDVKNWRKKQITDEGKERKRKVRNVLERNPVTD